MNPVEIEILINGVEGANSSLSDLRKQLVDIAVEMKATKDTLRQFYDEGADVHEIQAALERYESLQRQAMETSSKAYLEQKKQVDQLRASMSALEKERGKAEEGNDAEALNALNERYAQLSRQLDAAQGSMTLFARARMEARDGLEETSAAIERCKAAIADMGSQSDNGSDTVGRLGDSLGANSGKAKEFSGSVGDVVANLKNFPGPVGQAVRGIDGLTKASLRFIATPVGIVLAAISAALALVSSWFHRTEEGQNALAVATSYFTQVLESVLDVADKVGEWIFKAFTKPKEAAVDLVNFVKGQVINRLTAMGEAAKGIMMILNGDFSAGAKQLANGWLQSLTGVKDVTGKIAAFAEDTNRKATTRMEITRRQNALDKEARDYTVQKAKTEAEIAKLRAKGQDTRASEKERQKAAQEASRLTTQMYDKEISLARKKYEIIRDTNALSNSNKADKQKEADAEAEIYRLETRRNQALGGLTRVSNRAVGSAESSARKEEQRRKKEQAEAERRQQLQQKLGQELADLQRQNDAAEIAAMKEGIEKKLREIDNEYQARKNAIDKQEADWQRDNKKAGIATGENGLTADQTAAIEKARRQAAALTQEATNEALREEEKANREAINGYLRQYGDYAQKRQAITEQANDRICELEEELARATTAEAQAAAQARIDTVKAETREQLEELDVQYGKAKQFMIDLFEDASQKSVGEIDKIIRKYEELVKFLKGDGSTSREQLKDLGFSDAEIDKALEKLSKEGVQSIKAVTDTLKGLKGELQSRSPWQSFESNLNKGIEMLKKADGDISKIGKGVSGIGEAVSDFTPQLQQFSADLANIFGFDDAKVQDAIAAVGGLGQTAAGVGQMMSGDVVGGAMAAVNGISTMVDALDGLFGADYSQYNRLVEQYEGLIDVWDTLIDRKREYVGVSYGAEAIKAGKEALELIEKEGEAYRTLGKERLNSGASAGSHSIGVRIKKNTSGDDWRRIAQSLGMSVSAAQDTLGGRLGGLFDLSSEQIKKLQEENQVWWAKLDGDVRKYLEGIIDSEEKWAAMQEQMRERLTTTTRENVFDDFLGHLYDLADGSSEVMDGIADNWQQMVNRMAVNNLVGAKFRQSLEGWYEELAELNEARAGGSMTDAEYRSRIDALKAEYDGYVEAARRDIETLRAEGIVKATGDAAATTQSGKAGGFSTMTQDQGTKLEGLFVSGQMHWASIDEKMTDVADQLGRAGDTLRRIEENTGANAKTAAVILDKMKELIRDGIKVK